MHKMAAIPFQVITVSHIKEANGDRAAKDHRRGL